MIRFFVVLRLTLFNYLACREIRQAKSLLR